MADRVFRRWAILGSEELDEVPRFSSISPFGMSVSDSVLADPFCVGSRLGWDGLYPVWVSSRVSTLCDEDGCDD